MGTDPVTTESKPDAAKVAAPAVKKPDLIFVSDEGVNYTISADSEHITNVTDAKVDLDKSRRRELHISGRTYEHTADNASGQWVYRRAT